MFIDSRLDVLKNAPNHNLTYMVTEGYFHKQVCPNINKHTKIEKHMHVQNFQAHVLFAEKENTCGHTPQRRTGLVK
jgi:hypothetical protein